MNTLKKLELQTKKPVEHNELLKTSSTKAILSRDPSIEDIITSRFFTVLLALDGSS